VKRAIQPFHWGKAQLEARNERVCSVWLLQEIDENEVGISGYLRMFLLREESNLVLILASRRIAADLQLRQGVRMVYHEAKTFDTVCF